MIPYTKPYLTGLEQELVSQALAGAKLSGNGAFTQKCQLWLSEHLQTPKTLLTQSCTNAIEMAALLLNLQPGDEVILPSFTFVSSANPFVLRGAVPVFVDIRPDTMNLDETKIEQAITPRTRAIMPVHYAGVPCEMDTILSLAQRYKLWVVADSAQAIMSLYKGRPAAGLGHLSAMSFHDTKNISSGEGGALLLNDSSFFERAEILWEKGTNRSRFLRGEVDKYTWVDVGSSFLPSELTAAYLWAQLQHAKDITEKRLHVWQEYHRKVLELELRGFLKRPTIPPDCTHNAHIFYVLLDARFERRECIEFLKSRGVQAVSHYVPLHSSPAGRRFGRTSGELPVTDLLSEQLLRLPLWPGLDETDHVISALRDFCLQANVKTSSAPLRGLL